MNRIVIGIVGAEEAKFTELGMFRTKQLIFDILMPHWTAIVCSGGCHLGGVDIWAEEVADALSLEKRIYPPARLTWAGGYRERNIQIAKASHELHVITVDKYPKEFRGMRFPVCYHCGSQDHIKSGGCWTGKEAKRLGKVVTWHTVNNY